MTTNPSTPHTLESGVPQESVTGPHPTVASGTQETHSAVIWKVWKAMEELQAYGYLGLMPKFIAEHMKRPKMEVRLALELLREYKMAHRRNDGRWYWKSGRDQKQ